MIKVYCIKIDIDWGEHELRQKMKFMPLYMRQKAMKYVRWQDRQLYIAGKLLLLKSLEDFTLTKTLRLQDLLYNPFDKPYFNHPFHFNISHSGNIVVCAASTATAIGIDIEKIQPIPITDYTDYFTANEINSINSSNNKTHDFYKIWTKKEALIKCIGKGFGIELSCIETLANGVSYEGTEYYFKEVAVASGYICYIASTVNDIAVTIINTVI
jgi:4'-phosphopantetheinyl transferase